MNWENPLLHSLKLFHILNNFILKKCTQLWIALTQDIKNNYKGCRVGGTYWAGRAAALPLFVRFTIARPTS